MIRDLTRIWHDRRMWRHAATLGQLGELTARWLEGTLAHHPGYGGGPSPETTPLIPLLAAANRSGLVTISSQPGNPPCAGYDGALWAQRPALEAVADFEVAERVCQAAGAAGLHVDAAPADADRATRRAQRITVTTRAGAPYTEFGPVPWRVLRDLFADAPAAAAVLRSCWQLTLVDLDWHEGDLLWRTLADTLGLATAAEPTA